MVLSSAQVTMFQLAADNQADRARSAYLRALLRQPAQYFDEHPPEDVVARMSEDTVAMRNGIGSKLGQGIHNLSTFFAAMAVGFFFSWEMTLIMFTNVPVAVAGTMLIEWAGDGLEKALSDANGFAGQAAAQAIAAIRTVSAFGRERTEATRYSKRLGEAQQKGITKQYYFGLGMGMYAREFAGARTGYGSDRHVQSSQFATD